MIYTGVGSRGTPPWCLNYFKLLGQKFATKGWILRSGGCIGADLAFENGCDIVSGQKEIYIPWKDLKRTGGIVPSSTKELYRIANEAFEPRVGRPLNTCKLSTRALMERNVCQVLGITLHNPSNFLLCWTKDGTGAGGTGQAITIANKYNVPILDFGLHDKYTCVQATVNFLKGIIHSHI